MSVGVRVVMWCCRVNMGPSGACFSHGWIACPWFKSQIEPVVIPGLSALAHACGVSVCICGIPCTKVCNGKYWDAKKH